MTIAEPVVTLTDYGLFIECVILAFILGRQDSPAAIGLRNWFVIFLGALGFAAFMGGTSHGFIYDETSPMYTVVWDLTLIGIGVVGISAWMIGMGLLSGTHAGKWSNRAALLLFSVYCAVVLFITNVFLVAIVFYLPAVLFLLAVFFLKYLQQPRLFMLSGVAGLLLTLVAAGIQQAGYGVHPVWFDHNAVYHLIQAVAIFLIFHAARGLTL